MRLAEPGPPTICPTRPAPSPLGEHLHVHRFGSGEVPGTRGALDAGRHVAEPVELRLGLGEAGAGDLGAADPGDGRAHDPGNVAYPPPRFTPTTQTWRLATVPSATWMGERVTR